MSSGTKAAPAKRNAITSWARRELEFDAADVAELRGHVLSRLSEEQFLPSEGWDAARRVLSSDEPPDEPPTTADQPDQFFFAEDERLRGEVQRFARQMFSVPPERRRALWKKLCDRAAHSPRPSAWLEELEPGLDVSLDDIPPDAPLTGELAEKLCRLFVLRPQPRAVLRDQFREPMIGDVDRWSLAARTLQSRYPQIAALDPLAAQLADWKQYQKKIAKRRRAPARSTHPSASTTSGSGSSSFPTWLAVIFVALAVKVIFLVAGTNHRPKPEPSQLNFKMPDSESDLEAYLNGIREKAHRDARQQMRRQPRETQYQNPQLPPGDRGERVPSASLPDPNLPPPHPSPVPSSPNHRGPSSPKPAGPTSPVPQPESPSPGRFSP